MSDKYSILLMRDDKHVRRFRISPRWITFLLCVLISVFILAAGGVYISYDFWTKNENLLLEKKNLEKQLADQRAKLERLQEYEKYLENNDPAQLQAMAAAENSNRTQEESAPAPAEPLDLDDLLGSVDLGRAQVENFTVVHQEGGSGVSLGFDLKNVGGSGSLAGNISVVLLGNDGREIEVELQSEDLAFQIENFKTIAVTVLLPAGVSLDSVFGLRLSITDNGDVLYSRAWYPLSGLLAR